VPVFQGRAAPDESSRGFVGVAPVFSWHTVPFERLAPIIAQYYGSLLSVRTPGSNTHTTMAAIKVTLPLYSGGYTSSQSRQAYEQYNNALEKKIDTERTIIQNARAKHIAAGTDVHRVNAQARAISAARSALDATRAGYKSGIKSIVDVLQSQRTLFATMRDHATARYDYVMDMLKLKQLAGTLSPSDIYELDKWLVEPGTTTAEE